MPATRNPANAHCHSPVNSQKTTAGTSRKRRIGIMLAAVTVDRNPVAVVPAIDGRAGGSSQGVANLRLKLRGNAGGTAPPSGLPAISPTRGEMAVTGLLARRIRSCEEPRSEGEQDIEMSERKNG